MYALEVTASLLTLGFLSLVIKTSSNARECTEKRNPTPYTLHPEPQDKHLKCYRVHQKNQKGWVEQNLKVYSGRNLAYHKCPRGDHGSTRARPLPRARNLDRHVRVRYPEQETWIDTCVSDTPESNNA
jgi:hypothetical protein